MHDSEAGEQAVRGLLFRISARVAVIVFVVVLAMAVNQGLDLSLALVRGLIALVAITACGWLAEKVAQAAWQPTRASAPPEPVENAEPPTDD